MVSCILCLGDVIGSRKRLKISRPQGRVGSIPTPGTKVKMRDFNADFFKKWSPDMAYILGYIAADGCVVSTRDGTSYILNITSIVIFILEDHFLVLIIIKEF